MDMGGPRRARKVHGSYASVGRGRYSRPKQGMDQMGGSVGSTIRDYTGSMFRKREFGKLPPDARKVLERKADYPITKLEVIRTPLDFATRMLMNGATLGQFDAAVKKAGYDAAFHLAVVINGRTQFDKQEVVRLAKPRIARNTEKMMVPLPADRTITYGELVDKTRAHLGDRKFSNYDARDNNCQDFVVGILEGNGLMTPELMEFTKQDTKQIFEELPGYMKPLGRAVTDLAAVGTKILEGEGMGGKKGDKVNADGQTAEPDITPKNAEELRELMRRYHGVLGRVRREFGSKETSNVELEKMLEHYGLHPGEVGPRNLYKGKGKGGAKYGVYNTDDTPPGTHWFAACNGYAYDPLGDDSSRTQEQPDKAQDCGQRCVAYLILCKELGGRSVKF